MSKRPFDVFRLAFGRALVACRDDAIALLNAGVDQRSKQQSRRGALVRATAARADSSDKLALEAWDDDGGRSGTSEVDERYTPSSRSGARAPANASL